MKLLITDFDRTFYREDDIEATLNNVTASTKFLEQGNLLVIATGRPVHSIRPLLDEYNVPFTYLIGNDGGNIYDSDYNLLSNIPMDNKTAKELFELINNESSCGNCVVENGQNYLTEYVDNVNCLSAKIIDIERCNLFLDKLLIDYPVINGYMNDLYLIIHDYRVTKTFGIKTLLSMLNDNYEIIVVGDSINDIDMIKEYDGYAMIDSYEVIKELTKKRVATISELIEKVA